MSQFRFELTVLQYDTYGTKVVARTPASILAKDKAEVTDKMRTAFNAEYDDFRGFWSHWYHLDSVSEVDIPTTEATE